MDPPAKLGSYFSIVDDFFKKTFRDDSCVFIAVKTRQYSESFPGKQLFFAAVDQQEQQLQQQDEHLPEKIVHGEAGKTANYMSFSPRLLLNRDGTAFGKVKLGCGISIPRVCRFEQGLTLTNGGVVSANVRLHDILEGLQLRGRVAVNTIAPASEDISAATIDYQRRDLYASFEYQRNGLGSSDLLVDCGTKFFNLLAGAGFERQKLSYLEREDASAQMDVIYAGLGFSGVNWSIGAKMVRANDAWSTARVAFYQLLAPNTSVACGYTFDLSVPRAHLALGFSQGLRFFIPAFLRQAPGSQSHIPLVAAVKGESSGLCSASLRGVFNKAIRWGIVVQKNMLMDNSSVRFGVNITMESE